MTLKPLVFFGNERLASAVSTTAPTLRKLIDAGYPIKLVVANDTPGISRKNRQLEIATVARESGIPVLSPSAVADIVEQLREAQAVAGVLVAYGQIIPQHIIDVFPAGIINIHPSLLPRYRGPTPIESTILNSDSETGVSLMNLSAKMDAGAVYAQAKLQVTPDVSKQQLADELLDLGGNLLLERLPGILDGSIKGTPQDETKASYTKLIKKSDGQIDWRLPAMDIQQQVRAFAGWPGAHTKILDRDVIICQAHSVPGLSGVYKPGDVEILEKEGILMVHCAEGYLCIDALKPAGKNEISTAEFIRGYAKR